MRELQIFSKQQCLSCFEIRSQKCMWRCDSVERVSTRPGELPWGKAPSLQPFSSLD